MPLKSKQDNAIAAAEVVAKLMGHLATAHDLANAYLLTHACNAYDTCWSAFPTAPWNADGTVGFPDAVPNPTHPIYVPPSFPIMVARNDLASAIVCLQNFQSYMTGLAVAAQTIAPRKCADTLNK